MTVEDLLKRRMRELLLRETPYVLEEARFGMFDLAVYVPEDCAFEGLSEAAHISATRTCNFFLLDGTCSEKKKTFLSDYVPEYDEQCLLTGFRKKSSDTLLSEKEFNELIGDIKTLKKMNRCDTDERDCDHLRKCIEAEQCFSQGLRLRQGLHLLEFKSDHDDVNRFLEQLPHYAMLADYIWLVLGSRQKLPKWMPSYVGIFREQDEGFVMIKDSQYQKRLPPLNNAVLKECGLPAGLKGEQLYAFMRKWFINSIFYRHDGLVVSMNELDNVLIDTDKKGKQKTLF